VLYVPITLQALFAPDRRALQFAIKTLLGGGLALWLALRWGLEQPAWALMTAFIVAQPLSGMVVQKGLARLLGTLIGTIMSVVFMSVFAQTPWLFLLALALWLGLCTASSTLLRSAWSYSFVLAGYTVAIIALPAIAHPLTVFDQAVARLHGNLSGNPLRHGSQRIALADAGRKATGGSGAGGVAERDECGAFDLGRRRSGAQRPAGNSRAHCRRRCPARTCLV